MNEKLKALALAVAAVAILLAVVICADLRDQQREATRIFSTLKACH